MRKLQKLAIGVGVALAAASLSSVAFAGTAKNANVATYKVTFVPTFTQETHPFHYDPSKQHISPLIGATYKKGYQIYMVGKKPTPGLERLSERGKGDVLAKEMKMAKKKGLVYSIFTTSEPLRAPVPKSIEVTFKASKKFPLVSVVGMVAPSPDWFLGVKNIALYKNGGWVPSKTVKAYAYDSGGDAGKDYTSPNQDLNPKQKTKIAKTKHFLHKDGLNPVGTFIFTKVPDAS